MLLVTLIAKFSAQGRGDLVRLPEDIDLKGKESRVFPASKATHSAGSSIVLYTSTELRGSVGE